MPEPASPPSVDAPHVCKPGAGWYFCPTADETESDCHGGFDVCCDRPDLHQSIPACDRCGHAADEHSVYGCLDECGCSARPDLALRREADGRLATGPSDRTEIGVTIASAQVGGGEAGDSQAATAEVRIAVHAANPADSASRAQAIADLVAAEFGQGTRLDVSVRVPNDGPTP